MSRTVFIVLIVVVVAGGLVYWSQRGSEPTTPQSEPVAPISACFSPYASLRWSCWCFWNRTKIKTPALRHMKIGFIGGDPSFGVSC